LDSDDEVAELKRVDSLTDRLDFQEIWSATGNRLFRSPMADFIHIFDRILHFACSYRTALRPSAYHANLSDIRDGAVINLSW
jgi:hypothetical protein